MLLMIPAGFESAAPDAVANLDPERVEAMMAFNESLRDAGVLISLDGLHPPSMGARVSFATGEPIVTDGPFTETKEVLGGYWIIRAGSLAEAVAWAKRCPATPNETIEVRQIQDFEDYSPEVRELTSSLVDMQPLAAGDRR
jgi:hypothetical protein